MRQPTHWLNLYRDSWLARRIVSVVADDMTRMWRAWRVEEDEDAADDAESAQQRRQQHLENAKNIKTLEAMERVFNLKKKTNEAVCLARLFGTSAFLLIIRDDDLATPLDLDGIGKGDLKFLHVVDQSMLQPWGIWDFSLFREGMLDSEFYRFTPPTGGTFIKVHKSRLIYRDWETP